MGNLSVLGLNLSVLGLNLSVLGLNLSVLGLNLSVFAIYKVRACENTRTHKNIFKNTRTPRGLVNNSKKIVFVLCGYGCLKISKNRQIMIIRLSIIFKLGKNTTIKAYLRHKKHLLIKRAR